MFLTSVLSLFRTPVRVHVSAPASTSPPDNQPHPSPRSSCSSSPSSPRSTIPATARAVAAADVDKQLVPKDIARCSPTITTTVRPVESKTAPLLAPPPRTKAEGTAHEDRFSRHQWNPLYLPAPPKMVKGDSIRPRAITTPPTKIPSNKSVLSYFASAAGQKFLDNLEKETILKRKNSKAELPKTAPSTNNNKAAHETSLGDGQESRGRAALDGLASESQCGGINREHVRAANEREHVATGVWSENGYSQSQISNHFRGADAMSTRPSRATRGHEDVFDGEQSYENTPTRSKLSLKDQVTLRKSFDQLLQDTKQEPKTKDMGLGRLEFGYPFRLFPPSGTKALVKAQPPTAPATQAVARAQPPALDNDVTVSQTLPPNSRVVLVSDGTQDESDMDRRGLPRGSSVVLIIDQDFGNPNFQPQIKAPETSTALSKPRRHNPLRDTVRLRWRVFHPDYTEKSEFIFEASPSTKTESKRKLSALSIEQSSKRTRDDDMEGPVFNEKQLTVIEQRQPAIGSIIESAVESPIVPIDIGGPASVSQPIAEDPATVEEPAPIIEPTESKFVRSLPTPPPDAALSPVSAEDIIEVETEDTPPSGCPTSPIIQQPSPSSRVASPIPLEFSAEEEAEIKEAIKEAMKNVVKERFGLKVEPEASTGIEIDPSALPLPDSPIIAEDEQDGGVAIEPDIEPRSPDLLLEPGTPPMSGRENKMVPYMPLTPPETPLSMRNGMERVIEFNLPVPTFLPPSPALSILDSPIVFRGKGRQVEDTPSHYFVPTQPSPSPSHSVLDSPPSARMRRIRDTIKEEDEEEVANGDGDDSDVEEIIRSPKDNYPSPPHSPMGSPYSFKGKELSRVPSFTIIYSPSPPASILNVPMIEDEAAVVPTSPIPNSSSLGQSKGKKKEREESQPTYPSPVLEQQEGRGEEETFQRSTPQFLGWATADDIFAHQPDKYHYTYDNRPLTPASSINSLSRRWSGISSVSYNTGITTPPATRPGSAVSNYKMIGANENGHKLRREHFQDQISSRTRKPLFIAAETSSDRPSLRWSLSMPLIREEWAIRHPLVVSPAEQKFAGLKDEDIEEYDVQVPGCIQLLPLTRGVIVTPPRVERRRRPRPISFAGPHRRKVKTLVVYSPDDQLEGLCQLFGEEEPFEAVKKVVDAVEIVDVVEPKEQIGIPPKPVQPVTKRESIMISDIIVIDESYGQEAFEDDRASVGTASKEKKRNVLRRLKLRASTLKEKVKTKAKVHSKKGKEKAHGVAV